MNDLAEIALIIALYIVTVAGFVSALVGPPIFFLWLAFGGAA